MTIDIIAKPKDKQTLSPPDTGIPPLQPGDVLTRPEFERRYKAHPEIKKAELIEGVVFMPSPVKAKSHGDPHFVMNTWLGVYCAAVPGLIGSDNSTLRLDLLNEPQPDILVRFQPEYGGRTRMDEDGYLEGSPELTLEIAASSSSYDMNQKKETYARHGIQEYIVVLSYEQRVVWHSLENGVYQTIEANELGILQSKVLPGLWLQPSSIWDNDLATIIAVLQEGLTSQEYTEFVANLANQ